MKKLKVDMTKKEKILYLCITILLCLVFTLPFIISSLVLAYPRAVFANAYPSTTKVGYETEYLGTVDRNIPAQYQDEGLVANGTISAYPTYGRTLSSVIGSDPTRVAARNALIAESWGLCTINTRIGTDGFPKNTYNSMNKDGKLFLNGQDTGKTLYKHTSANGMYGGNVSDEEKAVIKRITMAPTRGYTRGYNVTGLYAPAGEVVKIEISQEDMDATAGIAVHVGQALFNGKANNIWVGKNAMNRMPVILNTWVVNKSTATLDEERGVYTAYVGSHLGGPIYVVNENVKFSVTISGAVRYSHFILGFTTEDEFEENKNSSAPYFDLEVFYNGVLHSGPKAYAQNFSYEEIYDAGVLWEKISLVSTQVSHQGIVFLYDPFVAAGAAVAFPGQGSVNCPAGWMANSLNVSSFTNSGGWGNMHEYNHNFQGGWGVGDRGEVTNNAINLVEYSLFTKISAARKMGGYGGEGLSGWNAYTSATWALQRVKSGSISSTNGLAVYATLLHNFGQDVFMSTTHWSGQNYFLKWGEKTHQDFSYFNSMVASYTGQYDLTAQQEAGWPMFIPVSSIYQTGRSYMFDGQKKYIETMQPYTIKYGQSFTVDLNKYTLSDGQYESGSVILPEGFSYTIKKVTKPQNGKIKKIGENVYQFTPNKNLLSGKIYVTLGITNDNDASMKIDDVDLVLEFQQSHEMDKNILERTTYTYSAENMYKSDNANGVNGAITAYENKFAGYESKVTEDNNNYINGRLVQNSSSEIWGLQGAKENTIMQLSGKLYVSTDGDYRISLRGRKSAALYVSTDNEKTYHLAANLMRFNNLDANFKDDENHYTDLKGLKAGTWVHFKAVLVVDYGSAFVGVGWGQFAEPMITSHLIDPNDESKGSQLIYGGANQTITLADGTTKVITTNMVITDEEASLLKPTISVGYANAYRNSYDFANAFESDYFYLPKNQYNYNVLSGNGSLVEIKGFTPWDKSTAIDNLFDDNNSNKIHNARNTNVSEENPFDLTVDLGEEIRSNTMTIYGVSGQKYQPKTFVLYGGTTRENMQVLATVEESVVTNNNVIVTFEEQQIRFYRLLCTDTHAKDNGAQCAYIAMRYILFSYSLTNGNLYSPDNQMFEYRGRWNIQNHLSNFGHIYCGKNASMQFTFTGTNFAILSNKINFENFDVFIDGGFAGTGSMGENKAQTDIAFVSNTLKSGMHTVTIRSKASFNIDSIVIW